MTNDEKQHAFIMAEFAEMNSHQNDFYHSGGTQIGLMQGKCNICGEDIGVGRLIAFPHATRCIDCQDGLEGVGYE